MMSFPGMQWYLTIRCDTQSQDLKRENGFIKMGRLILSKVLSYAKIPEHDPPTETDEEESIKKKYPKCPPPGTWFTAIQMGVTSSKHRCFIRWYGPGSPMMGQEAKVVCAITFDQGRDLHHQYLSWHDFCDHFKIDFDSMEYPDEE